MITTESIQAFLNDRGHDLVELGKLNNHPTQPQEAEKMIRKFYGYNDFSVLFKPTKAADIPFRATAEGALSYFIGQNTHFPEDHGFALAPWTKVTFEFSDITIINGVGITMGHYFFTDTKGDTLKVEFSFVVAEDSNGMLKIVLHHSSLPYQK